jgi:hypothetical protein
MDPDACLSTIFENVADGEWTDAAHCAEDLRNWISKGGFPPGGGKLRDTSIAALLNWLIAHPQRGD